MATKLCMYGLANLILFLLKKQPSIFLFYAFPPFNMHKIHLFNLINFASNKTSSYVQDTVLFALIFY